MSHSGSRRDVLMGCAKQHVALPASIWEVQFAQLLRRSGPNIPQAAVANQHGATWPPRHACDKADIRPARGGGFNKLGEGTCSGGSGQTDGRELWPPAGDWWLWLMATSSFREPWNLSLREKSYSPLLSGIFFIIITDLQSSSLAWLLTQEHSIKCIFSPLFSPSTKKNNTWL